MHDSAIAIVSASGKTIYASSLERVTRKKQDGRFPSELLKDIPWDKIDKVAISNEYEYILPTNNESLFHPVKMLKEKLYDRSHQKDYYTQLKLIDKKKLFYPHHLSHASSSFYASGFKNALCLVYDGGMANEHWFGGVYNASLGNEIKTLDMFSAQTYSNITFIYSIVTTLLGFSPLRHEGKITGLAALGNAKKECKKLLISWLKEPEKVNGVFYWDNMYKTDDLPILRVNTVILEKLQKLILDFSQEDLAATVQELAEEHVLEILKNIKEQGFIQENICLSGGLFANVKINQKVYEFGFKNIFISPPMSDDGTALGAAWLALHENKNKVNITFNNVYLGNSNRESFLINKYNLSIQQPKDIEKFIADELAKGLIFAIYQGNSEFGPRSLGNRSIIAQATQNEINNGLNNKLSRTEFMPFAPIIRDIDAEKYFYVTKGELLACKYMTITTGCTEAAKNDCPAVVHVDNTARPQIIENIDNPLLYRILTEYAKITHKYALVNTSFNIHEEPIIDSSEDAIKGFFESGLDYLYLNGYIISLKENYKTHAKYLKTKLKNKEQLLKKNIYDLNKYYFLLNENNNLRKKAEVKASQAETRTNDAIHHYNVVINSNSWKVTKPLRYLMKNIKSIARTI